MEKKITIRITNGRIYNSRVVMLKFPYNREMINILKSLEIYKWSSQKRVWYTDEKRFSYFDLEHKTKHIANIDSSGFRSRIEIPASYKEKLIQRRYSENTIKNYTSYFRDFAEYFSHKELENVTHDEINAYILELIQQKNISGSQQNLRINAIKFYYEKVLKRSKKYYDIDRPRKEKRLPDVLSKEEVRKMINTCNTLKKLIIITLLYSAGLRRSEVINLKLEDIDSKRMLIRVKQAKGNKDRNTQLSEKMLANLREYYKQYKPLKYVLEGSPGKQYSETSILNVVKEIGKKAGISRKVTPHMLRHCFATHLLESGVDQRYIQEWLGHASAKTTQIYTHVANRDFLRISNPLDELFKEELKYNEEKDSKSEKDNCKENDRGRK